MLFLAISKTSSRGGITASPSLVIFIFLILTKLPEYSSTTILIFLNCQPFNSAVNFCSDNPILVSLLALFAVENKKSSRSPSDRTKSLRRNEDKSTPSLAKFSLALCTDMPESISCIQAIAIKECKPASK